MIANELRAAAALNGWDQSYTPSPILSPRHASHQPKDFPVTPSDPSPMTTEPSTPFMPSYNINQTSLWASDLNPTQLPWWLVGETPYTTDSRGFVNETMCYAPSEQNISTGVQLPIKGCDEGNLIQETFSSPSSILSDLSNGAPVNQPLYYVATGETSISKTSRWYSTLTFKPQQRDCFTPNVTSHEQYFSTNQNHRPRPF